MIYNFKFNKMKNILLLSPELVHLRHVGWQALQFEPGL